MIQNCRAVKRVDTKTVHEAETPAVFLPASP
jgi:hypothetical protein